MIHNMTGGGAGLNLKVVGGTTQPTNPAENTVWVNTDTEISGYAFSATEPENPTEGMVWFATGQSSPAAMNVDKKNTVMIYPSSCQQYIGGAWVAKTAKTYQNGVWVDWWPHYFDNGNQFEAVTGGWTADGYSISGRTMTGTTAIDSTLYVKVTDKNEGAAVGTVNPVNLTDLSTLFFNVIDGGNNTGNHYVGVSKSKANDDTAKALVPSPGLYTVDVSELSGDFYIVVYVLNSTTPTNRTLTVDHVYGEQGGAV